MFSWARAGTDSHLIGDVVSESVKFKSADCSQVRLVQQLEGSVPRAESVITGRARRWWK
jgi:hypothetical protein